VRRERERQALRELDWLCSRGLAFPTLVAGASAAIRLVVAHERFCFHTVDPVTHLMTGGLSQNLAPGDGYQRMLRNEYVEEDVNKWADLARRRERASTLTVATRGRRERSVRYRELLRPQQCEWELRVALVERSTCWGAVGIYRSDDEPDFAAEEVRFLAAAASTLAGGFRRSLIAGDLPSRETGEDGPGVVVFDEALAVEDVSPAAARWAAELRGPPHAQAEWLPAQIWAVATAAANPEAASGDARTRVLSPSGEWLLLQGARLGDCGRVAVVIEPARRQDLAPLIAAAYGLTAAEWSITELVLRGLSTAEIAHRKHLSPYTVQDHLKSVFTKVGIRSRRELVARVFYDQHLPRIMAGARPDREGALAP